MGIFGNRSRGFLMHEEAALEAAKVFLNASDEHPLQKNEDLCNKTNVFKPPCIYSFMHVAPQMLALQLLDFHDDPTFDLGSFVHDIGDKAGSSWGRDPWWADDPSPFIEDETKAFIKEVNHKVGSEVTGYDKDVCRGITDTAVCLKSFENICGADGHCYRGFDSLFSEKKVGNALKMLLAVMKNFFVFIYCRATWKVAKLLSKCLMHQ